ncbi:MAG: FKBP-type peptidyl-prolyl cis-trans isomerase [Candidatus Omnitrophota bacterium]
MRNSLLKCLGTVVVLALLSSCMKPPAPVVIEKGKKVKMNYVLKVDDQVLETTLGKEPFVFIQGEGTIVSGLESGVEGMKVGEEKTIIVPPEKGFGPINPDSLVKVPKTYLPPDVEIKEGVFVMIQNQQGQQAPAMILKDLGSEVVLNLNHPFAGLTLQYEVEILGIE